MENTHIQNGVHSIIFHYFLHFWYNFAAGIQFSLFGSVFSFISSFWQILHVISPHVFVAVPLTIDIIYSRRMLLVMKKTQKIVVLVIFKKSIRKKYSSS